MGLRPPCFSRRALLWMAAAPAAAQSQKGAAFPSDRRWYPDPLTELTVFRLTNPAWSSYLPPASHHPAARRGNFLLYGCDRTGKAQAFRMDLGSGESRQLTEMEALDAASITLHPDERSFFCFDGPVLKRVDLRNLRERVAYRVPPGWERCPGFSLSGDGRSAALAERRQGGSRLQLVGTGGGGARTLAEADGEIRDPLIRPGRQHQVLYRQGGDLWLVDPNGRNRRKLALADGTAGPALWHPGGESILYLNFPTDPRQLHAIREYSPESGEDKLVARTSQFVSFASNRNTSVFLGASRNAASPAILLLLRVTRREFTVCEHRASDPAAVVLAFSPDSQAIFFQSDRHGKPAIYSVRVDKIVEET